MASLKKAEASTGAEFEIDDVESFDYEDYEEDENDDD
jgi:hypothetical protein